jgi:hypothetical protein
VHDHKQLSDLAGRVRIARVNTISARGGTVDLPASLRADIDYFRCRMAQRAKGQ